LNLRKTHSKNGKSSIAPFASSLKKKLEKIIQNPHIPASRLSGFGINECYKIKLRQSGYRLVYEVLDGRLVVMVVGVGKREKNKIYRAVKSRIEQDDPKK